MKSIAPLNVTGERNERVRIIVSVYYGLYAWIRTPPSPPPPVTHCSFSASHDSLEALGLSPASAGVTRVSVFLTFCASPDTHASAIPSDTLRHATRRD